MGKEAKKEMKDNRIRGSRKGKRVGQVPQAVKKIKDNHRQRRNEARSQKTVRLWSEMIAGGILPSGEPEWVVCVEYARVSAEVGWEPQGIDARVSVHVRECGRLCVCVRRNPGLQEKETQGAGAASRCPRCCSACVPGSPVRRGSRSPYLSRRRAGPRLPWPPSLNPASCSQQPSTPPFPAPSSSQESELEH